MRCFTRFCGFLQNISQEMLWDALHRIEKAVVGFADEDEDE